eukprot:TRINITY_DN6822_c0_g1_i11.p1 TRINITY_DN6822_c0_g1~~TRINITY_DN6822_c0_g1_i11.p1  ORF type:complete len:465 (+),score=41.83 TRINITY_DN6822_c0_g1_i11:158-1552(+)
MLRSLVGSEMCIRDRCHTSPLDFATYEISTTTESTTQPPPSTTAPWMNASFVDLLGSSSTSVQQEKMCDVKYPPATIAMLKRTLAIRRVRRVAIIAILRDCIEPLLSIDRAIFQVADVLSPENVFVSILESGSGVNDTTPIHLREMSDRLQARGVSNVISTGENRVKTSWVRDRSGSRIGFLSKLRNAAMLPALDGHPVGHFDKFYFINDVFNCGGDILRLLAHDADIACGLDFGADNDDFYDKWVHAEWLSGKFDYPKWYREQGLPNTVNTPTFNVFACWNGGIASVASLWYDGVRFREGMYELGEEDCPQSEATLWSMDAHTLGYHNIIVDPTVHSGYGWRPFVLNFRDSSPTVKAAVASPTLSYHKIKVEVHNISYRCCEIHRPGRYVHFDKCHTRKLVTPGKMECAENTTKCLRYTPDRWVDNWDWQPLIKNANNTSQEKVEVYEKKLKQTGNCPNKHNT